MDVFRLNVGGTQGELINGFETLVWTERYLKNGNFKMTADYTPQLQASLPVGSYISHFGSKEIFEVMDHQISKKKGKAPKLIITGDSLETFLKYRPALPNLGGMRDRFTNEVNSYVLPEGNSWDQAAYLIRRHLTGPTPSPVMAGDWVSWINTSNEITGTETPQLSRIIERGTVYERVLELLAIANCGIKTRRPTGTQGKVLFVLHKGVDRSSSVILSATLGELGEADYFWSNRQYKNASYTEGQFTGLASEFTGPENNPSGINRRTIRIDATDIENDSDPVAYGQQLYARETQALNTNNMVELTNLQIAEHQSIQYNRDFFIGDIVGIAADFGIRTKLRVEEFTWSIDASGVFGYPTFTLPTTEG